MKGGEKNEEENVVWMLSFVFVLSMVSLTLAQEKPKAPAWQATVVKGLVGKGKGGDQEGLSGGRESSH